MCSSRMEEAFVLTSTNTIVLAGKSLVVTRMRDMTDISQACTQRGGIAYTGLGALRGTWCSEVWRGAFPYSMQYLCSEVFSQKIPTTPNSSRAKALDSSQALHLSRLKAVVV